MVKSLFSFGITVKVLVILVTDRDSLEDLVCGDHVMIGHGRPCASQVICALWPIQELIFFFSTFILVIGASVEELNKKDNDYFLSVRL